MIIDVLGTPAPQGSKRHVGNGKMIESSKAVQPWREAVKWAVRAKHGTPPTATGPVRVGLTFAFQRPRSHYRTGKHSAELRPDAPMLHAQTPDLDKLIRSTLDALVEAGVMRDDKQVAIVAARKVWQDAPSGALITVTEENP